MDRFEKRARNLETDSSIDEKTSSPVRPTKTNKYSLPVRALILLTITCVSWTIIIWLFLFLR